MKLSLNYNVIFDVLFICFLFRHLTVSSRGLILLLVLDGVRISGAQIIGEGVMATIGEGVVQTFLFSGIQIFCLTPVFQSSRPIVPMFFGCYLWLYVNDVNMLLELWYLDVRMSNLQMTGLVLVFFGLMSWSLTFQVITVHNSIISARWTPYCYNGSIFSPPVPLLKKMTSFETYIAVVIKS